jgi:hypothetical protein
VTTTRDAIRSFLFGHPGLHGVTVEVPRELPAPVRAALPIGRESVYAITPELGSLLASYVLRGRRRVLEFGAGASSRVHAAAMAHLGDGMLTSIELDPSWCSKVWTQVSSTGIDARMVPSPIHWSAGRWGIGCSHTLLPDVEARAPYDLVLIDGPGGHFGRLATLPLVAHLIEPGAVIIADDARGQWAQWALATWLRLYPGLRLAALDPVFGRRGVAILEWKGGPSRFSLRAWFAGCYHALSCWRRRRGVD